ncbi:hypothetical protein LPB144_12125 [Christiangramia salexigens]|uniref:Secretion system C-terminal sorting domain-containing protein n=2 Tax=Christiangramia salexigens TaxID=1913577 RepID=A0A1L3J7I0_9FLAO|nr:hypothetical protein LPB144_12125 [Christiangramia salexigens]
MYGQTSDVFDLPDNCVAGDLLPVGAFLSGLEPCIDCEEQDTYPADLSIKLDNKTGSTRTAFAFWAILEVTSDEGIERNFVYGCSGPVEGKGISVLTVDELTFYDENGVEIPGKTLEYQCGTSLLLKDLIIAWTPASDVPSNRCPITADSVESKCRGVNQLRIDTPLGGLVDTVQDVTCFGGNDGSIDIKPIGGKAPYSFDWADLPGTSDPEDRTGLSEGSYSVTITDSDNCEFLIEDIEVGAPSELEATFGSSSDATCNGYSDGSIDINVSGGTPSYTYLWSNGATTQDLTGIAAGTYSVVVTDANGCTDSLEGIEVGEPSELEATFGSSSDATCNGYSDGSIDINVSGGTPSYTYLWSNGATTQDLTGIAAGTYSVVVTDANGCTDSLEGIEVGEPSELEATFGSSSDATCNGYSDGSIDIDVSGGTPSYTYLWSNGATTQDLTGIAAGTYSVVVTDANGCTDSLEGIEVGEPSELEATFGSSSDATCNGYSDGSIDINVIGGTPSYTYLWSNGATTQDLTGIAAGTYSVVVTDANGCTDSLEGIEVGEPSELEATFGSSSDATCNGYSDGSIDIDVSGGTPSYTYLWSNGATTQDLTGIAAGTYSVVVTDANGCTDSLEGIEVGEPSELEATFGSSSDATCSGELDGAIDINVIGGTPSYTYLWSNGATTQDLTGIAAGIYSVVVTDANGCTDSIEGIEVADPSTLEATFDSSSDATCNGYSDGSIDINVIGGTPSYTYLWSNGATTQDLTGIAAGTYSVVVTDANGCTDSINGIEVGEPNELEATFGSSSDATCNGYSDGSIDIDVIGGTPSYTYLWSNGATTQDLTGIAAGTYSVVVTDANGCTDSLNGIEVGEPNELEATFGSSSDATCNGYSDGSIDIDVIGGTPSYTYLWSNGATTQDLTGIAAGTYSVVVTDANGCTDSLEGIEVGEPSELEATFGSSSDATCSGELDGAIDINVIGGTPSYTYLWSNGATTQDLTGIAAGTYSVVVTDANGCTDSIEGIEVADPSTLEATFDSSSDATCNGYSDGSIDINVIGGTPSYTYLWSNGATTQDLTGIAAGTYSVVVTDANGCTDSINGIEVGEPSLLDVQVDVQNVTCPQFNDGIITFTATGGTPPYSSEHGDFNEAGVLVLSGLSPGEYGIVVSDANQCALAIDGIIITEPEDVLIPTIQPTQATCIADAQGSVALSYPVDSGITQFFYSYKTKVDDNYTSYLEYTGPILLSPGNYDFKVKYTEDGCESIPFDVSIQNLPNVDFTLLVDVIPVSCDTGLGNIKIKVGVNPDIDTDFFTYKITSGAVEYFNTKQTLNGFDLPPGTYVIFGLSDNECDSGRTEIIIDEPICEEFEGCTLGYWKNHTDRWPASQPEAPDDNICNTFTTCLDYGLVFTNAPSSISGMSLLEALNARGGGIYNLARQSVAALLNACKGDVNYELSSAQEVIDYVNANFNNASAAGSYLDMLNNAGCTLGGSRATTAPSLTCPVPVTSKPGKNKSAVTSGFKASPVPFKDNLTIQYEFDYVSDVTIQVFDLKGQLLKTFKDKNVTKGDTKQLDLNMRSQANQVYILRMQTKKDVFTKNIISSKK